MVKLKHGNGVGGVALSLRSQAFLLGSCSTCRIAPKIFFYRSTYL